MSPDEFSVSPCPRRQPGGLRLVDEHPRGQFPGPGGLRPARTPDEHPVRHKRGHGGAAGM